MMHLYSALLSIVVHPKRFTIMWGGGGLSSTTTSVQQSSTFVVNVSEYLTYIRIWLWGIWYFNLWQSQTHYQSKSVFLWLFSHFIVIKYQSYEITQMAWFMTTVLYLYCLYSSSRVYIHPNITLAWDLNTVIFTHNIWIPAWLLFKAIVHPQNENGHRLLTLLTL